MYLERENQIIAFSENVELKQGIASLKTDQMKLFFRHNFDEENFYKMSASGNIIVQPTGPLFFIATSTTSCA